MDANRGERWKRGNRRPWLLAIVPALAQGCAEEPAPRPQLVVEIDTDAPVVGQLLDESSPSPAVAIDTVRVDVIREDREVLEHRSVAAPDVRDWPVSFGVASQSGTPRRLRLRIRAFKERLASRGILDGTTTIEPPENVLIDRLVDVPQAEQGVERVRVLLATACLGAPVSFATPARTCVDASRRDAAPSEGVSVVIGSAPTRVGTAVEAQLLPCERESPAGARCIPGGATVLGDPRADRLTDGEATVPRRPVLVSPFHMDVTEVTVGRYRALVRRGATTLLPNARDPSNGTLEYCTWLGPDDPKNDDLPLNCISYDAAARACALAGGTLPTDVQWEHAARGRGRDYLYPWGDESPSCCTASVSRVSLPGISVECGPGAGVEPAGSHRGDGCAKGDVSLDGILDLGGSLREAVAAATLDYADACWSGPGLRLDPPCTNPAAPPGTTARGGEWSAGRVVAVSAARPATVMPSISTGFRCVYPDTF